jgi:hypothetical protein
VFKAPDEHQKKLGHQEKPNLLTSASGSERQFEIKLAYLVSPPQISDVIHHVSILEF